MPPSLITGLHFLELCVLVRDNPGICYKLLLLKIDCCIHNERTSSLTQSHKNKNKHVELQTFIIPSPHPDPHFSLKHFMMTKQTNTTILSVWLLGDRFVIISLICYYMSRGEGGVGYGGQIKGERRRLLDFCWKHNCHGPVTFSVKLCYESQCAFAGPPRRFIKQGAGPLRRCLCSLCGSNTQRGVCLRHHIMLL